MFWRQFSQTSCAEKSFEQLRQLEGAQFIINACFLLITIIFSAAKSVTASENLREAHPIIGLLKESEIDSFSFFSQTSMLGRIETSLVDKWPVNDKSISLV